MYFIKLNIFVRNNEPQESSICFVMSVMVLKP